jgi:two-component system alkaline phosphatase synthesis response regulator PhoP
MAPLRFFVSYSMWLDPLVRQTRTSRTFRLMICTRSHCSCPCGRCRVLRILYHTGDLLYPIQYNQLAKAGAWCVPTVLIVDDEPSILKLVAYHFEKAGFQAETSGDGRDAYERIRTAPDRYDLVVLDWMLPGMDGLDVCKRLRGEKVQVPIILLTARDEELDLVLGLEMGADDYVTKPFSPRELVARARAVLRRMERDMAPAQEREPDLKVLRAGALEMDPDRHEVRVSGAPVELTPKEFDLLRYMMERRGRVLSRDQLLDRVWGYAASTDTRIVDVHVSHLREKIEPDPKHPRYILTVRGVGYKFSGETD